MFITLYQYRHQRFVPVKEYYTWHVQLADELDEGPVHGKGAKGSTTKIPCPGCGKVLARAAIRYDHMCSGDLTDRPVNNMRYLGNRRWEPSKGEPDPEGCPVPTAQQMRAIYNADTNARTRTRRASSSKDFDDCVINNYTTTTTADPQQSAG
jgi:hypothetical protein